MLEVTQKLLFGVILLLIIIIILYSFASSPDCDQMADESARSLRDAINIVSESDFPEWRGELPPSPDDTRYYKPVVIKFCEKSGSASLARWFGTATQPSYQIFYEEFPQSSLAIWDETYPWSGDMRANLFNYLMLAYGTKGIIKLGKSISVAALRISNVGLREAVSDLGKRLKNWANFWITGKDATMSALEKYDALTVANLLKKGKLIGKSEDEIAEAVKEESKITITKLEEEGAIAWDPELGKYTSKTPEGRKLLVEMRDVLPESAKKIFDQQFYIPPRWNWASKIARFSPKVVAKGKTGFYKAKIGFYNKVTYPIKESIYQKLGRQISKEIPIVSSEEVKVAMKDISGYCRRKPQDCMKSLEKWLEEDPQNQRVFSDVLNKEIKVTKTGKVLFSTSDMFRFMDEAPVALSSEERLNGKFLAVTFDRRAQVLNDIKKNYLTKPDEAVVINQVSAPRRVYVARALEKNNFDQLTPEENSYLENYLFVGIADENQRRKLYEAYAAEYSKRYEPIVNELPKGKRIVVEEAQQEVNYKALDDLFKSPPKTIYEAIEVPSGEKATDEMMRIYFPKTLDPDKAAAWSTMKNKLKGWFFIRLNRIYPTTLLANPGGIWVPSSKFVTDVAAERLSAGCYRNSLCLYAAGKFNVYPLQDSVEGYSIKIWRPKPSWAERMPIGIQTVWFQTSVPEHPNFYTVSPCLSKYYVWKHGGTIYISAGFDTTTGEKTTCPVFDENGNIKTAPNYCYADYNYVWGSNFQSSEKQLEIADGAPIAVGVSGIAFCIALQAIPAPHPPLKQCVDIAMWGFTLEYAASASGAALSKPPDSSWGYWSYYKVSDSIDLFQYLDMLGGFGGFGKNVGKGAGEVAKKTMTTATRSQRAASFLKEVFGPLSDLSVWVLSLGDTALAWPGRVKDINSVLTEQDIYRSQGQCMMRR